MTPEFAIAQLKANQNVFKSLLVGLTQEQILFKPDEKSWCLLEILCHLRDEEREDFRSRVKHCLETPADPMPSIDPSLWVTTRKYIEQDFTSILQEFIEERIQSIQWLETLQYPRWENSYDHPKLGKLTARFFLFNWLAHDYLHIRQINKRKYEYVQSRTEEDLSYAGTF